jgi:hypothetical protein
LLLTEFSTSTGLIYRLQGEILTEISRLRSNSSIIRVEVTQNNPDSSQIKQIMQIYESDVLTPIDVTPSSETKDLHPSNEVSSRLSNRLLLRHGQFYISSHNWSFNTPFWSLRQRALVKRVTNRYASPREPLVEEDVVYVISPSAPLRWIGISRGVSIYTKPTAGWQFTLQPFTVIPEKSPIFEFCREGNLAGVRTLLKLGQASVRDRDPSGRTPLHVSTLAPSLQTFHLTSLAPFGHMPRSIPPYIKIIIDSPGCCGVSTKGRCGFLTTRGCWNACRGLEV